MYHIGILAPASPFRLKLKKTLEVQPHFSVEEHSLPHDLMESVKRGGLDAIVFKVAQFKESHIETLKSLRDQLGPNIAIVMVAASVTGQLRTFISDENLPGTSVIDARYEMDDLKFVLKKLMKGDPHPYRKYCRYSVFEASEIYYSNGASERATMVNLSYGGAQVKLHRNNLKQGDRVSLRVDSNKQGAYDIDGRVVWSNTKNHHVGIEFKREPLLKVV